MWVRARPFVVWYGVTVFFIVRDWVRNPFDPELGAHEYGQNHETALMQGLVATTIELAALLLLFRPWSPRASVGRRLLAVLLFGSWSWWLFAHGMHHGGIYVIHLLAVMGLTGGLLVALVRALRPEARKGS
ncbi:MAG: hypothetical protein AAF721_12310 [Myxococcota bacterium]